MRLLPSLALAACATLIVACATPALAQPGGGGGGGRGGQGQGQGGEDRHSERDQQESGPASLPSVRAAGPCPYVKVLYDAGRYVEFKDGKEASASVAYTGEIEGLSAGCAYKNDQPISVGVRLLFGLGRGPSAHESRKTYRYWVAVTDRNRGVLAKQYFDLPVSFPSGQDRVSISQDVSGITIPRADVKVSGSNFEVLVGFDVTPAMAEFNRQGKRFRANAGVAPGQ